MILFDHAAWIAAMLTVKAVFELLAEEFPGAVEAGLDGFGGVPQELIAANKSKGFSISRSLDLQRFDILTFGRHERPGSESRQFYNLLNFYQKSGTGPKLRIERSQ